MNSCRWSYEIKTPGHAVHGTLSGLRCHKGIGAALAARIVRHFKADTFRVMEEEPERLSEVKGISEKMAMAIAEQVGGEEGHASGHDVPPELRHLPQLGCKIYQEYGPKLYSIIKENPYRLADDIPGWDLRWPTRSQRRSESLRTPTTV